MSTQVILTGRNTFAFAFELVLVPDDIVVLVSGTEEVEVTIAIHVDRTKIITSLISVDDGRIEQMYTTVLANQKLMPLIADDLVEGVK